MGQLTHTDERGGDAGGGAGELYGARGISRCTGECRRKCFRKVARETRLQQRGAGDDRHSGADGHFEHALRLSVIVGVRVGERFGHGEVDRQLDEPKMMVVAGDVVREADQTLQIEALRLALLEAEAAPSGSSVESDLPPGNELFEPQECATDPVVKLRRRDESKLCLGVVQVEDIEGLQLEIGPAPLDLIRYEIGMHGVHSGDCVSDGLRHRSRRQKACLGADYDLGSMNFAGGKKLLQRLAHRLFGTLVTVIDGRIEEVDSASDGRLDCRLIGSIGGLIGVAQVGAEAQARDGSSLCGTVERSLSKGWETGCKLGRPIGGGTQSHLTSVGNGAGCAVSRMGAMRVALKILTGLLAVAAAVLFTVVEPFVDGRVNRVTGVAPLASERAKALAARSVLVDMHADSLLWGRDLNARGTRGQVDVPRLIEGHIAVQAFTIVTKSPRGLNFNSNGADAPDDITPLAIAGLWPVRSWTSLLERALYQASRFEKTVAASGGKLVWIRTRQDLDEYLEQRKQNPTITAGFLGVEGAHALNGNEENVTRLFDAGVRMMSPTHFFDNEFGGSAAGERKGGLTEAGKELVRRMEAMGMVVDVAHSSESVIDGILAIATKPVVSSHTGVKGTCNNPRNLSDQHLRGIASTGGLISIAYFEQAVCGVDPKAIAAAARHAVSVAGIDHVGLGSDFDGAVTTAFDTSNVAVVLDGLLEAGFSEEEVGKIAGLNAIRVLRDTLPVR